MADDQVLSSLERSVDRPRPLGRSPRAVCTLDAALGVLVLAGFLTGVSSSAAAPTRSESNANYHIEVGLDPSRQILTGRQTVTWSNQRSQATSELPFHLYWNAWRNRRSTWMLEDRWRGRSSLRGDVAESDWGWIQVDSVRLLSEASATEWDLSDSLRFISPDDGNPDDRTVMVVDLPYAVEPESTITVELVWRAKVPRTFARTGFRGRHFFLAHWFPKLGVFEGDGWNCHQYHASTEFFSDYGQYDVAITVPSNWVVGATGRLTAKTENRDGTVTWRHEQEDVHAFTWTTSPDYEVLTDRFAVPGLPPVDLRLLIQPEHRKQARRHLHATKVALERYGRWYGPYPYGHVTVVDPAWGTGFGGMEYPTLFTCGTRLFNPFGGGSPEHVTIHEAGHQFWYGVVGNNEFEHAWLDEGLNTFSTVRAMHDAYGSTRPIHRFFTPPATALGGFFPVLLNHGDYGWSIYDERRASYRSWASIDRQETHSYEYFPQAGGALSYSKTALWLGTLERLIGWERLQPAMASFFREWSFRHPSPDDFFQTLSAETGTDLKWFFDEVYRSSEVFDYAIARVETYPAANEGMVEVDGQLRYLPPAAEDEAEAVEQTYRSEVMVSRLGGGRFPIEILLRFDDGHEERHQWDGRDRWHLITRERNAKLSSAEVDPDRVLLLDINRTNNSLQVSEPSLLPAAQWAIRWMFWLQDFLSMVTFFA